MTERDIYSSNMLGEEFAKEEQFLKGVQAELETKRTRFISQINRLKRDLEDLEKSGNYETAAYVQESLDEAMEKFTYLDALEKNPYYARIDFLTKEGEQVSYHVGTDKIQSTRGFHVYAESSWPRSVLSGKVDQLFISGKNLTPNQVLEIKIADGKLISVHISNVFENAQSGYTWASTPSEDEESHASDQIDNLTQDSASSPVSDSMTDEKLAVSDPETRSQSGEETEVEDAPVTVLENMAETETAATYSEVPADKQAGDTSIIRIRNTALESLKSLLDQIQDLDTSPESISLAENMEDHYEQFAEDLAILSVDDDTEQDTQMYSSLEEIKSLSLDASFIVQGFSGCGKKEILKDRARRMMVDPNIQNEPVVLGPTSLLASELTAFLHDRILKVYSFSQYYALLFEEITGEKALDIRSNSSACNKPEIYSEETLDYINDVIRNKVQEKLVQSQWDSLHDLERDLSIPVSNDDSSAVAGTRWESFSSALELCRTSLNELERTAVGSKRKLEELKTTKQNLDASIKETKQNYERIRLDTIDSLNNEISSLDSELNEIPKLLRNEEIAQEYITNESKKLSQEVVAASALRTYRSSNRQKYIEDASVSMKMSDEEAAFVHKTLGDLENRARQLQEQLNSTSSFNFIKRNRMQSELKSVKEQLLKARQTAADYLENSVSQKIKQAKEKEIELSNQIDLMSKAVYFMKKKTVIENSLSQLRKARVWNRKLTIASQDLEVIHPQISEYENNCAQLDDMEKSLYECVQNIQELEKVIQKTEKASNITGLKNHYAKLKEVEEKASFKEIRKLFEKNLLSSHFEIEGDFTEALPERAVRYLELLIAEAYYQTKLESRHISVLQAQELSVGEMQLLTFISGNSVWNLYGDINQCTDDATGLTDWEQIQSIKQMPLYCLNECTGKSKEISEFCNKTFYAGMIPAGSSKAEVQLPESLSTGAKSLLEMKHRHNAKCSIILSPDQSLEENKLLTAFDKNSLSFHEIDESKISVLYPEEALGLSFDAALVITDKMNQTQKYISYTRPNDYLILYGEQDSAVNS